MLSNDAIKLLKWFEKHDEWMTPRAVKNNCDIFDDRAFKALITEKLVDSKLADEGDSWVEYRISDRGAAYLKKIRDRRLPELREWINFLLPILTFLSGLLLSDPVKGFFQWLFGLLA